MAKDEVKIDWREARRESARSAIVDAAWELVQDEGLAGLAVRDLARQAGITTPTVYSYFDSKSAIHDAMFAQAAEEFATYMAQPFDTDEPQALLLAYANRFLEFCTSDVPRYQLLFQRAIPGFEPSPESFAPAIEALDGARELLARSGISDPRQIDVFTALMSGLADQQIANDPGGDRWIRLVEDCVTMFANYCGSQEQTRTHQPLRARTKGKKS